MSKFPKLGIIKPKKYKEPEQVSPVKPLKLKEAPMSKFVSLKRTLGKEKRLSKRYKI